MATIKKILINPRRKTAAKKPARKRATNPVLGLNPTKGRTMKARTKKAAHKKNPAKKLRLIAAKSNPVKRRRTRRNPTPGMFGSVTGIVKTSLLTLTGLELTRQLPQMLLAESNTGVYGYAANAATIAAASYAASKLLGKDAGTAVAVGGAVYLIDRLLTEQFSAAGNLLSLSGLGDYQAHVRSTARVPGMAGIRPAAFSSPVTYDRAGAPQIPDYISQGFRAALPIAPPTSAMSPARRLV